MKYSQQMIEMRLEALLKRTEVNSPEELQMLSVKENVLVISPHFDDDVLSCYAAMTYHVKYGHKVDVLYVTDGSACEKDGCIGDNICEVRRKEAKDAILSLSEDIEMYFLDQPDGTFIPDDKSVSRLKEILMMGKYTTIYSPHWQDGHKDHRMTAKLLNLALSDLDLSPQILIYEFWMPLQDPDLYVKLDPEIAYNKWKAIECHKSQMSYLNYKRLAQMINEVRGKQLNLSCCEVFKKLSKEEFLEKSR